MIIDTHAHLNFAAFDKDREEMIKKCLDNNIWMINVGTRYETSAKAVKIAGKYEKEVYSAIGIHPMYLKTNAIKIKTDLKEGSFAEKGEDFNFSKYKKLAKSPKVVAIGEIGLDYYYLPKDDEKIKLIKQKQKKLFLEQFKLAKELNLPVIIHCRKAHNDLIEILKTNFFQVQSLKLKGVIHSFTGNWTQAKKYIDMGFYLGFNGIIFKLNLDKIIKKVPLERILVETDCPYLTPPSFPEKRNNPLGVKIIIQRIADIKKLNYKKVVEITTKNARGLFKI